MGRQPQAEQLSISESSSGSLWSRWVRSISQPVNGASLGVFRIAVGFILFLEAITLFRPSQSSGGVAPMQVYFTGPGVQFHLPYPGFEWLPLLPAGGMHAVGWILALSSLLLMIGWRHRIFAAVVFLCWGYLYAVESTRTYWMSYYYLELLVSFLLIWMPASRRFGIDGRLSRIPAAQRTIPAGCLAVLRGQLVITYFYAGVAKINPDWLLDYMPVRWFLAKPHVPARLESFFGSDLAASIKPWLLGTPGAAFLSWAGAVFDLSIGFLMLFRRTRLLGFILLLAFHGTNHFLLFDDIEWFPLVGICTASIFFAADWPDRFFLWLKHPQWKRPDRQWLIGGALLIPGLGAALGWKGRPDRSDPTPSPSILPRWATATTVLILGWLTLQTLIPLRHHLFPGDPRITFEGLSFSWRLKAEVYRSMPAQITVADPAIISPTDDGRVRIDWDQWPGDAVLHRAIVPGRVPWAELPALVAVSSPGLGERILFNPRAAGLNVTSEAAAREVASRIWADLYGRPPAALHRSTSLAEIIEAFARAAESKGMRLPDRDRAATYLMQQHGPPGDGRMVPFLRRTQAFATSTHDDTPEPFLWLDDPVVLPVTPPNPPVIVRSEWKTGPATRGLMDAAREDSGRSPLTLHIAEAGIDLDGSAPQFELWQAASTPPTAPVIRWNLVRDTGFSKAMHIGVQPFLLRRYAQRVAAIWDREYHRKPAVHALTSVSLNGRPPQPVVDPAADLATVSLQLLRHEPWIRDLALERIPGPLLESGLSDQNTAPASP
jgi:vitamin K-dependent gamma-carboxylase